MKRKHFKPQKGAQKRLIWLLAAILGIWLGFPNDFGQFPPAVFLWPCAMAFFGLYSPTGRSAFFWGWLASFGGSSIALYWLSLPVHQVGNLPWPLAILCALFISACLSLQGAIFAWAIYVRRCLNWWRLSIFGGLLWYLLEYSFAVALGFPWLPLAGAIAVWPVMIQTASVLGSYFLGGIWVTCSLLCLFAFCPLYNGYKNLRLSMLFCGSLLGCCILVFGLLRLQTNPLDTTPSGPGSMHAIFVEGNIDQNQKWVPEFQLETLGIYEKLTMDGLARAREQGLGKPLVIWPETALPFFPQANGQLDARVREFVRQTGSPLLFGAPGLEKNMDLPEDAVFNRAFLYGPDGQTLGYYDKEHLVPFGEYLPQWLNLKFLEALLQGVGIYQQGVSVAPLHYGNLALGMLICYEGIFPWLARDRVKAGANLLVDISNDGWFGTSPASRQHLYLTILRCVEQNRWLLRGTNTGISAVFDNYGRAALLGPQFHAGYLMASARLEFERSLYYFIEPWLAIASFLVICLLLWMKAAKNGQNSFSIRK